MDKYQLAIEEIPGEVELYKKLRVAKNTDDAWEVSIKARDESRLQKLALRKFLLFTQDILPCVNIYRNFPIAKIDALRKILSFAVSFETSLEVLREVNFIPELRMLILGKALGFADSLSEFRKLLKLFPKNSDGALICEKAISKTLKKPEEKLACAS